MNKDKIKKNLKIAALTGATVCIIASSLIGCGVEHKNTSSYDYSGSISSSPSVSTTDADTRENTDVDFSQSYNAYLYNNDNLSLSSPVSINSFVINCLKVKILI